MSKAVFSFLFAIFFSCNSFSADTTYHKSVDPGLQLLKQQVINDILSAAVNEAEVLQLAEKMKADGSWADIDYTDKTRGGWKVADHLARLNNMAVLFTRAGSKWKGDQKLGEKIIAGLNFWIKNDFICPNWWYPEIGVPKVLGPTMLLIEDKLSPVQMEGGLKILNRAKIGMTGQNKVWLSGNVIYRSLLTDDVELVKTAVKTIQDEVVVSEGEGIQADFSYHQHGPQQQFGNYGSAYAADMLKWAVIFQNTPFQFDTKKVDILRNYLLKGMMWIVWKNKMDISACGRQLFPHAQVEKAKGIERIVSKMPLVDPVHKNQYVKALDDFTGNKHFWRSDMTVHRRENFYSSLKMASKRVAGAESCNEENVQGYHLGDGATYFYQSNQEYNDIFPFWDWKMIPGTTAFHDAEPLPMLPCSGYRIQSDFVGGVTDGMNGVATLAYNRDNLNAQKSWFFFDDAIICLGAGINSDENKEVRTTINQSLLAGNVSVKQSTTAMIEKGEHHLTGVSWVLHDHWAYYFPGKAAVELTNRQQTGDWNSVLKRMPATEMKADLFTMYINHQAKPKDARYAYYVFPAATVANIDSRAAAIEVVANSPNLQVVEHRKKLMSGFVFVEPGKADSKLFNTITANEPCVVMISKKANELNLTVADPSHKLANLTIGLQGKRKGTANSTYDAGKNLTLFTLQLPQEAEAGKSVTFTVF